MKTNNKTIQTLQLNTVETSLFEAIESPVLLIDVRGNISKTNKRFQDLFQDSHYELIGKPIHSIIPQIDSLIKSDVLNDKSTPDNLKDLIVQDVTIKLDHQNDLKCDIKVFHIEFSMGKFMLIKLLCLNKVINKIALEEEKQLKELKSRFISMASHEFRTPLTATLNALALLERYIEMDGAKEKQKKQINRIKQSIHRLNNVLSEFLSLDKLSKGKFKIDLQPSNLHEFFTETVSEMNELKKKKQKINLHYKGENKAQFDEQMLRHIIVNLLSNAIKYSPEGTEINVQVENDNKFIHLTVEDQGIGIPANEQKNIFSRFFRSANASNIQGTGLGLHIVKSYIDLIQGHISFESNINKGSTFKLKIPQKINTI